MAKTIKEERLRWVIPIAKKEVRLVDAAKVCPYGKRSLERWPAAYRNGGATALEPKSTEPKRCRAETPIWLKERIIGIRKDKKNKWNIYYNNLEHCGLSGKTPNEFLTDYQLTNPPNV